jgi:hypothetical protein
MYDQKHIHLSYFGDDDVHVKTFHKHPAESAQEKEVYKNGNG